MTETKLRALTWREPFATLMLCGKIETRSWQTKVRGRVLICAAQKGYTANETMNICGGHQMDRGYDQVFNNMKYVQYGGNFGHAIGIGELVDCRPMEKSDEDACFVMYREGLWCHIYKNVRAIKPIPWKGKQGWMKVPAEIESQIEYL